MFDRKMLCGSVLMVAVLVLATGCSTAATAASTASPPNRSITVVGWGKAYGTPDVAYVTIGVETSDESVQKAVDDNEAKMTAVLAALKALGIDEKDMQTSNFSVFAESQPQRFPEAEEAEGPVVYRVNNQVSVKVRDLDLLGDVLDEAVGAGANSIYGIGFSVDDPSELEAEARADAVADAKERAESLAELNGVEAGDVVSISEVIGGPSPVLERVSAVPYGAGAPIEPGQLEIQMSVQITYAIQ